MEGYTTQQKYGYRMNPTTKRLICKEGPASNAYYRFTARAYDKLGELFNILSEPDKKNGSALSVCIDHSMTEDGSAVHDRLLVYAHKDYDRFVFLDEKSLPVTEDAFTLCRIIDLVEQQHSAELDLTDYTMFDESIGSI